MSPAILILITRNTNGEPSHTSQARFETAEAAEHAGKVAVEAGGQKISGYGRPEDGVWLGPWLTYKVVPAGEG